MKLKRYFSIPLSAGSVSLKCEVSSSNASDTSEGLDKKLDVGLASLLVSTAPLVAGLSNPPKNGSPDGLTDSFAWTNLVEASGYTMKLRVQINLDTPVCIGVLTHACMSVCQEAMFDIVESITHKPKPKRQPDAPVFLGDVLGSLLDAGIPSQSDGFLVAELRPRDFAHSGASHGVG